MSADPRVVVLDDAGSLAAEVAAQTVSVLSAAVRERSEAHLVVTGGSILEAVLGELGAASGELDWSRVHVWWGDERYVDSDSADRNDLPALATFLGSSGAVLHRMPAADAGFASVELAAQAYAAELAGAAGRGGAGGSATAGSATAGSATGADAVPAFDAVLLGLGPDGHCASLFPGHPGLQVLDRTIIAVHDSPKPPPTRLSFTFPALDAALRVWFIASGGGKADAVSRALGGADPSDVPSAAPRGRDETVWYVDQDAASGLPD